MGYSVFLANKLSDLETFRMKQKQINVKGFLQNVQVDEVTYYYVANKQIAMDDVTYLPYIELFKDIFRP